MEKKQKNEIDGFTQNDLTGHFADIIDAIAEVGYLFQYIQDGKQLTTDEIMESYNRITQPLIMYRQLLEILETGA